MFFPPEILPQSESPMRKLPHFLTLATAVLFVAACDSTTSTPAPAPKPSSGGPAKPEVALAGTTASQAYQAMFKQDEVDASNPMGARLQSLKSADATLRNTYAADPSDSRAAFALAITSLSLKLNDMAGTMDRAQANGLKIGGGSSTFGTSSDEVATDLPALARAVSDPAKAPLVHEIQDSLETLLLPTMDEAVELLSKAWSDPSFEFRVAIDPVEFPGDTLVIDRSDVGFALSILQAVRAQVRWLVSYDFDIDQAGSYAWIDTLGNWEIDGEAGISPAQNAALNKLKALADPNSSFLTVRDSKKSLLASVPGEFLAALRRSREAAILAYSLKPGSENHIQTITSTADRDEFLRVVDSAIRLFSGPTTTTLYARATCKDTSWWVNSLNGNQPTAGGYSTTFKRTTVLFFDEGCGDYSDDYVYGTITGSWETHTRTIELSTRSQKVVMDLSKLVSLPDLKVFLPRYTWNATSDWSAHGPVSFVSASGASVLPETIDSVFEMSGYDAVKPLITWADPTFGGVFPQLTTSAAVMELFRMATEDESVSPAIAARGPLSLY